jgi:hypothetical protein
MALQVPREGLVSKLQKLSQSQQSIESVASFCVFYHKDARGVATIWEEEFFKAPADRQMALLYLANHILQEGRRKGTGFQEAFYRVLPKAMSHVLGPGGGDDKMRRAATRLVAIWEERRVFGTGHIKSFTGLIGGGGGKAAAGAGGGSSGGGGSGAGGYQPARKTSGSLGPPGGGSGDAMTAAAKAAAAASQKRKAFEAAWRPVRGGCHAVTWRMAPPEGAHTAAAASDTLAPCSPAPRPPLSPQDLPIAGEAAAVTAANSALDAYEASLSRELDARRAAIEALQAATRQQEEALAAAAAALGTARAQRQQLGARMAQLSAGLIAALGGLPPQGPAAAAAPPPPQDNGTGAAPAAGAGGSPQAPAMEADEDEDGEGALAGLDEEQESGFGTAPAAGAAVGLPPAPGGAGYLTDALQQLPQGERDRLGFDLQQLVNSGLLAAPGSGPAGAAPAGGGAAGAFADEGDDPYDPFAENPF